ncbi:MAG: hypothetical protein PVI40_06785 [Chlamydiota bacterium]|jgi:hypothetical protein
MKQLRTEKVPREILMEEKTKKVFLKFKFKENLETGRKELCSAKLSDNTPHGSPGFEKKFTKALKDTTGSENLDIAIEIINKIAWGMSSDNIEKRYNDVITLLPTLEPQNETEALLSGQFLALQDSGMDCLRSAHFSDILCHKKEYLQLSVKLFRCANETMQTLLKYRSGGKQQIQVIHVSKDGKAVIANEINNEGVRK